MKTVLAIALFTGAVMTGTIVGHIRVGAIRSVGSTAR